MTLDTRITRLESRDPNRGNPLAQLSDDQLEAQIAELEDCLVAKVEAGEPNDCPPDQWARVVGHVLARRGAPRLENNHRKSK
jgi:hypothetical protein